MSLFVFTRFRVVFRRLSRRLSTEQVLLIAGVVVLFTVLAQINWHKVNNRADTALKKLNVNATFQRFHFHLLNIPYTSLNNGHCILKGDGLWDCPDIRTNGNTKLRQSQIVVIRMFRVFDALCQKHGFRYWITRGTLLGAVRHHGIIPWDTDLDVEMPIEDYVEFIKKAAKEIPSGIRLQRGKEENSFESIFQGFETVNSPQSPQLLNLANSIKTPKNPRLRDEKSCYSSSYCTENNCSWSNGMMLDMYPTIVKNSFYVHQFGKKSIFTKFWRSVLDTFGYDLGYKVFPLKYFTLEGFKVPVLNDWDRFLNDYYGKDYMTLPPLEKHRPPDDLVPNPIHACKDLYERRIKR